MGKRFDPDEEFADKERLLPEARKNILGIEAQLWSETIKGRDMLEYYLLPKLFGFAESAWTSGRAWETIEDETKREQAIKQDWNVFANTLGQREIPRLGYLNGGYNYRIPPPGAVVRAGKLYASTSFPGLTIRYSTDGTEPDENDPVYEGAIDVTGRVVVKAFDRSGNASRPMYLDCMLDTGAIYPCPD
jgi:hexosaminidase